MFWNNPVIQHNWWQRSRTSSLSNICILVAEQFLGNLFIKAPLISAYSLQFYLKKGLTFEQKLFVKLANICKVFFFPAVCALNQCKTKTKRNIKAAFEARLSFWLIHLSHRSHWKQSGFAVSGPPVWSFSTIKKLDREPCPHSSPFLHNMNKTWGVMWQDGLSSDALRSLHTLDSVFALLIV